MAERKLNENCKWAIISAYCISDTQIVKAVELQGAWNTETTENSHSMD